MVRTRENRRDRNRAACRRSAVVMAALERRVLLTTFNPTNGAQFAANLDSAQLGDTIVLAAGTTYTGHFVLKNKTTGSGWITIVSSNLANLPAEGVRVTPADAVNMPRIVAPGANVSAIEAEYGAAVGAHHFKFIGLEIAGPADNSDLVNLVSLGTTDSIQDTLTEMPHDFVIDRCYLHSNFNTVTQDYDQHLRRGIALNSGATDITNCYIKEIHDVGAGDSQAIGGSNGAGPYNIINNHLEAASENILFGGSGLYIPNTVPSDIVIRGNYCVKPISWRGKWTQVKNLFELKAGRRVTVEGNIFENCWNAAQTGVAIVIKVDQYSASRPWHVTEDIIFRNNIVRHAAGGVTLQGRDYTANSPAGLLRRLSFTNNIFYDIEANPWATWSNPNLIGGNFLYLTQGPRDVTFDHNTIINGRTLVAVDTPEYLPTGFVFKNNIIAHNEYGVFSSEGGIGDNTITQYYNDAAARFEKNVIRDDQGLATLYDNVARPVGSQYYPNVRAINFWPTSWTAVGFVDQANANFRLTAASPYNNVATDGTDAGVDQDALEHAVAGAINGIWFAYKVGSTMYVKFGDAQLPITLTTSGSNITANKWVTSLNLSGVTAISVTGTSADDTLKINAPISPPMTFADGAGNDLVEILSGTQTFAADMGTPGMNWGLQVDGGATATFNASQKLRVLTVNANGTATLSTGGAKVLRVKALSVAGKLNLTDNDLIWDYTGASPIGGFVSNAYTQLTGLVASGRNGGSWNGATGIVTNMTAAIAPNRLTTLGVSEAADAKHISGTQTALFDGQTVDATTVLVKYTYTGDGDLSGKIDGDDYFIIDSHIAATTGPASWGYWNGDFDYNGHINGDDYFLLDSNIGRQGVVL